MTIEMQEEFLTGVFNSNERLEMRTIKEYFEANRELPILKSLKGGLTNSIGRINTEAYKYFMNEVKPKIVLGLYEGKYISDELTNLKYAGVDAALIKDRINVRKILYLKSEIEKTFKLREIYEEESNVTLTSLSMYNNYEKKFIEEVNNYKKSIIETLEESESKEIYIISGHKIRNNARSFTAIYFLMKDGKVSFDIKFEEKRTPLVLTLGDKGNANKAILEFIDREFISMVKNIGEKKVLKLNDAFNSEGKSMRTILEYIFNIVWGLGIYNDLVELHPADISGEKKLVLIKKQTN